MNSAIEGSLDRYLERREELLQVWGKGLGEEKDMGEMTIRPIIITGTHAGQANLRLDIEAGQSNAIAQYGDGREPDTGDRGVVTVNRTTPADGGKQTPFNFFTARLL